MPARPWTLAALGALLVSAACTHPGRVVPIGPDVFRATRVAQNNHVSFDRLSKRAMGDAAAFCKRQGKVVEVVIVNASGPAFRTLKG